MRSSPAFLIGSYRSAVRLESKETVRDVLVQTVTRGLFPKSQLLDRVSQFHRGSWINLLVASQECSEQALQVQRRRRTQQDSVERRADSDKFWRMGQELARAQVPDEILQVIRTGWLTALQKDGIVAGKLVAQNHCPTTGACVRDCHCSIPVRSLDQSGQ